LAGEVASFRDLEQVHALPDIYHYWSDGHVAPLLRGLGYDSLRSFFVEPIMARADAAGGRTLRIVSLGSGNGDFELSLAGSLRSSGLEGFSITRLELNDSMRERAASDAQQAGLSSYFEDLPADLNSWVAVLDYDVAIASHSLHHVLNLEHLFEQVRTSLGPDGVFLVNDIIGRNGHMRWPEALDLVERIWALMPGRYRYNHQLDRLETMYENWDCSVEGFEGIRAQDILPLLNERFHPETFIAFANVIDLFVDRGFGDNFDVDRQDDRDFIDAVARLDEAALTLGLVKPTHLLAHYRVSEVAAPRHAGVMSPVFSVRRVDAGSDRAAVQADIGADTVAPSSGDSPVGAPVARDRMSQRHATGRVDAISRTVKALAALVPPIRRLRQQRDSLASEVESLRAQLAERN